MRNKILFLFLLVFCGFLAAKISLADINRVDLYFFYDQDCPACGRAEIFLKQLKDTYPSLNLVNFEVFNNQENRKLYFTLANAYGLDSVEMAVPGIFISDKVFIGYDDFTGSQIRNEFLRCLNQKCPSPRKKLLAGTDVPFSTPSGNKKQATVGWLIIILLGIILLFGLVKLIKKRK